MVRESLQIASVCGALQAHPFAMPQPAELESEYLGMGGDRTLCCFGLRAGLGAAWHLATQGYSVEVLEAAAHPGGLVAGWKTQQGRCSGLTSDHARHHWWHRHCLMYLQPGLDTSGTQLVPLHRLILLCTNICVLCRALYGIGG